MYKSHVDEIKRNAVNFVAASTDSLVEVWMRMCVCICMRVCPSVGFAECVCLPNLAGCDENRMNIRLRENYSKGKMWINQNQAKHQIPPISLHMIILTKPTINTNTSEKISPRYI